MGFTKVSELKSNYKEIIVEEQITRKRYFQDSEVIGWVLLKDNDKLKVYHLYQRGFDDKTKEFVNEPVVFLNEEIEGEELKAEFNKLRVELLFQQDTLNMDEKEIEKELSF